MKTPSEFPVIVKKGNSTVRIYRHQNAGYTEFKVAFYVGDKRKMETFADYAAARKRADDINKSVADRDLDALNISREDRILFERATTAIAGLGIEIDAAAREYAEARKLLGSTPLLDAVRDYVKRHPSNLKSETVPELVEKLIAAKRTDGASDVYLKDLALRLGKFAESFHVNAGDLTAELVNEWLRNLNCGGRSRNNYRRAVGTLLRYAETVKAAPKGFIALEDIALAKEAAFDVEIFTPEEMTKLLKAARLNPDALRPGWNKRYASGSGLIPLLVLGGFAGMRTAEIVRQRWEDIRLERDPEKIAKGQLGHIRVTAAKGNTAQKRLIPIQENLRRWLLDCWKDEGLCCTHARPIDAMMRLAERAKVEWKHNALRHSYVTYRVAETQNVPQVAIEAGNSVKMINRHYRELVTEADAKAWFAISPEKPANVLPMPLEKAV